MLKTEAITSFLKYSKCPIATFYNKNMEVQVNVAKDKGIKFKGDYKGKTWRGWKNNETGEIWKNFRIPWNADTKAEYIDSEINFDLTVHAEGIGMTGWDWFNKQSLWVGYDFDSIVDHKEGLSSERLLELENITASVEWITLLKSTSGKGIHLYIFFDKGIKTETHTEHAALARSLLSLLTAEIGYNFRSAVDCVGSILWCYHRRMEGTNGLTYLKKGILFNTNKIPSNWKEHILVCAMKKRKTKGGDVQFETLSSSIKSITLVDEHNKVLKWFTTNSEREWWWENDYGMLVCHTLDLKKCHTELKLKGVFETNSSGSTNQNAFCFPNINGSWAIRRHGKNIKEHPLWVLDESGWTKCNFNIEASFEDAARFNGALENEKGALVFSYLSEAIKAYSMIGIELKVDDWLLHRKAKVMLKEDGKILLRVEARDDDPNVNGFLRVKDDWLRVDFYQKDSEEIVAPDNLVRHVISQGSEAGWYVKISNEWILEGKSNILNVLQAQLPFHKKTDLDQMLGKSILSPWSLVNIPFEEEYPGNRLWNKDSAKIAFQPISGKVSIWYDLLDHIGTSLDDVVQNNQWCINNGVNSGSEWLFLWIANLFQRPSEPLPYLFLIGEQKTGKSTFHEALSLLFYKNRGYIRADQALKSTSGFNAELAHAVLCVVEETNLADNKVAANRIKDWVTGKTISIRALYHNAYDLNNTAHWIQCANDANNCPILRGDSRVTVIYVDILKQDIPKTTFLTELTNEAPAFLYELLNFPLPPIESRLAIPCLDTMEKLNIMETNYNELEAFIIKECYANPGQLTKFDEFFSMFQIWLSQRNPSKQNYWTKMKVALYFPKIAPFVKGKYGDSNITYIGNMTLLEENANAKSTEYFVVAPQNRIQLKSKGKI